MMYYSLEAPQRIDATILLPASKSISNRVLVMQELARYQKSHTPTHIPERRTPTSLRETSPNLERKYDTRSLAPSNLEREHGLRNISGCDDTQVMLQALARPLEVTDIHAAGTAMRFLTALFACRPGHTILTGTERMKQRPIGILVDALRKLGADIQYAEREGFPPLRIYGKQLDGGEIAIAGNTSSQYISALMMTAPTMKNGLRLHITGQIASRPYILMTMGLMQEWGISVEWTDEQTMYIPASTYTKRNFTVENDWSGASYWYEMLALADDGEIRLPLLSEKSLQGDAAIKDLFAPLGVETVFQKDGIVLRKSGGQCDQYEVSLENQPDLAQTIVVTCAMLGIPFRIGGLHTLRIKETDRLSALQKELLKLGYAIKEEDGDMLIWDGERPEPVSNPLIETYDDHRMAMAFAPCAMKIQGLKIQNPEVVSKSYPRFWQDLQQAGFKIRHS